jgi:hypothetical protein
MKTPSLLPPICFCTVIFAFSALNAQPLWKASLFTKNKNYVEIVIDVRGSGKSYIEDVKVRVKFLDSHGRVIKTGYYNFTDGSPSLLSNGVYRRYFYHDVTNTGSVVGDSLYYTLQIPGLKFRTEPEDERLKKKEWRTFFNKSVEENIDHRVDTLSEIQTIGIIPEK